MRFNSALIVVFALVFSLTGCSSNRPKPLLPVHDEVLVYPLAYDLTFLRTLEALQSVPGWDLEVTDKESGLIQLRNIDHTGFDNSDQRTITVLLKRLDGRQTSVELASDSQQVFGAGDLIKAISLKLSREVQA